MTTPTTPTRPLGVPFFLGLWIPDGEPGFFFRSLFVLVPINFPLSAHQSGFHPHSSRPPCVARRESLFSFSLKLPLFGLLLVCFVAPAPPGRPPPPESFPRWSTPTWRGGWSVPSFDSSSCRSAVTPRGPFSMINGSPGTGDHSFLLLRPLLLPIHDFFKGFPVSTFFDPPRL